MMSRRRLNNNNNRVIQRTTSETIRIGEPDILVNNHRPSNLPPLHPLHGIGKKTVTSSTSFVVTGVSARVDSITIESPDDSEDCSRQTDIETPSFSEDTSYSAYTEDVDYGDCEELVLKRCAAAVLSSAGNAGAERDDAMQRSTSPVSIIAAAGGGHVGHMPSPGRFIGRFQVVKVESIHPFRRGRWVCHDYIDNSDHAPRDGYEFFRGQFIKRKDLVDIKKQIDQNTFIFEPINSLQAMTQPLALVHNNANQLVFMNAPANYLPIIRAENTSGQSFNPQKMLPSSPRPILRSGHLNISRDKSDSENESF